MNKTNTAAGNAGSQNWYRMQVLNAGDRGEQPVQIDIYDEIGRWGISAQSFIRELRGLDTGKNKVNITINSNGGDVFDGIAIHNTIKRLGDRVTVRIDGVAASAASIIAVGAANVVMPRNAMMMIHNPWSRVDGEAEGLRKAADMLDKITEGLVSCYTEKSASIGRDEVVQMMKDTTWLTADEAIALGFADVIEDSDCKFNASAEDLTVFRRMQAPKAFIKAVEGAVSDRVPERQSKDVDDPSSSANAAALLTALAMAGVNNPADYMQACTLDLTDAEQINAEVDRITNIGHLCAIARTKDRAAEFIISNKTVHQVRQFLLDVIAAQEPDIDNKQSAKHGKEGTVKDYDLSPDSIYAARAAKPKSQHRMERTQ